MQNKTLIKLHIKNKNSALKREKLINYFSAGKDFLALLSILLSFFMFMISFSYPNMNQTKYSILSSKQYKNIKRNKNVLKKNQKIIKVNKKYYLQTINKKSILQNTNFSSYTLIKLLAYESVLIGASFYCTFILLELKNNKKFLSYHNYKTLSLIILFIYIILIIFLLLIFCYSPKNYKLEMYINSNIFFGTKTMLLILFLVFTIISLFVFSFLYFITDHILRINSKRNNYHNM